MASIRIHQPASRRHLHVVRRLAVSSGSTATTTSPSAPAWKPRGRYFLRRGTVGAGSSAGPVLRASRRLLLDCVWLHGNDGSHGARKVCRAPHALDRYSACAMTEVFSQAHVIDDDARRSDHHRNDDSRIYHALWMKPMTRMPTSFAGRVSHDLLHAASNWLCSTGAIIWRCSQLLRGGHQPEGAAASAERWWPAQRSVVTDLCGTGAQRCLNRGSAWK